MRRSQLRSISLGWLLLWGCHLAVGILFWLLIFLISLLTNTLGDGLNLRSLGNLGINWLFTIGIAQLVYVIPVGIWLGLKRRTWLPGFIGAAVMTALINSSCFSAVSTSFSGSSADTWAFLLFGLLALGAGFSLVAVLLILL
jgi:hypothetical protein